MTLIDTLRPEHRRLLRRLRKRIRQPREHAPLPQRHQLHAVVSRRGPAARGRHLWPADLAREHPLRRLPQAPPLAPLWLLTYALNPVEVARSAFLDGAELDDGAREDFGPAIPLLDELSALGDPCLRW